MDYNSINKIGKVKEVNKDFGVGEIVAVDGMYMFTINDISENVVVGDVVKFRGEIVNEEKRAFFIKKVDNIYNIKNNMIKSKIFKKE